MTVLVAVAPLAFYQRTRRAAMQRAAGPPRCQAMQRAVAAWVGQSIAVPMLVFGGHMSSVWGEAKRPTH